jgi:endonuclease/exonuclease/phosphatase family metal-dependent hydrolase
VTRLLFALLLICLAFPVRAAELKIATWNLEWLTDRPDGDRALPRDAHPKRPEDIVTLARYAAQLDADLIAIEEVDGREIAAQIFPPDRYSIHMTGDHVVQRVGLVVRRGLHYDVNPDDTALALPGPPPAHLRSGADITLHLADGPLRVLAVHLKTGCQRDPFTSSHRPACKTLALQLPPLRAWIAARKAEGVAFVVLGDFNRWMDAKDQLFAALRDAAPLARATEGQSSPCWGGERFIDHILAGGAAAQWMDPATLSVQVFRETGEAWKDRLSDHCAVAVRFRLPG